jgi:uncharacterized protein YraI
LARRLLVALLCLCGLLAAACGPESSATDEAQLRAAAERIALEYQAGGNLEQARSQLNGLAVANSAQWLLFVTESGIEANGEANTLAALVELTDALGLESATITNYAARYNLLPTPTPLPTEPVAVVLNDVQNRAALATIAPVTLITTAVTMGVTPTLAVTPTIPTVSKPQAKAADAINVRSGPGTAYNLAGGLQRDEVVDIIGKNPAGDWWQVQLASGTQGWVLGSLVQTLGDLSSVAVAANIPSPPVAVAAAPVEAAPAPVADTPTPGPTAAPTPDPNAAPHFTLVSRRLWSKEENGDCRGQHLLRIHVLDANGARLNGVLLKGIYIGHEIFSGSQGKGDGVVEYDLHGSGEGFMIIRNNDGRDATSDRAEGFTTRSLDIDEATLIQAGYCSNHETCQIFYSSYGCQGHHSWEAIFKRNY